MLSLRSVTVSVTAVLVVILSGCALSPQLVSIKPDLRVPVASYGNQRDVNVRVEDHRSNSVIGTRGGIYGQTSTIEIGNNANTEIAYSVAAALTRWGFRSTVDGYRGHALEFGVAVEKLSYQHDRSVAGTLQVDAEVSIVVESGGATYRGKYAASKELGYATAPSEEKNSEAINEVMSLALEKIFADKGLIAFLQQ